MIENLKAKTGKSLEEWINIVNDKGDLVKHGQIVKYLKEDHGFTHGFANLVALKALKTDSGSVEDKSLLVEEQFKGKEHFIPIYKKIIEAVNKFGNDIEIAPKKSYVSLRRKKQFSILKPATKSRFEVQVILKDQDSESEFKQIVSKNAMCTHQADITDISQISDGIINGLKSAYNAAG
ncbi:DUF5655 domain-containing protein [Marinigracilibium pacificum]|nr:DUF5655 domain-containing protein [Marinigracilibium pacificum]